MRTVYATLVIGFILATTARAGAAPIAIESHVGERPADAERYVSVVLAELARHGYRSGEDVGAAYEALVSTAATAEDPAAIHTFAALVDEGQNAWYDAKVDAARTAMTRALELADTVRGAIAQEDGRRALLHRALVILAMAHAKLGDVAQAEAVMAELVRSFPDMPVTRSAYGPEGEKLYGRVAKSVAAQTPGTIEIKADDRALVFVNEVLLGAGSQTVKRPPGRHRVLVRLGNARGRVYRAVVASNAAVVVDAHADLDAVLHTSPVWFGVSYPDAPVRAAREATDAALLGRLSKAEAVVVLRFETVDGLRHLTGVAFEGGATTPAKTESIALDPEPSQDRLTSFGAVLAGAESAVIEDRGGSADAGRGRGAGAEAEGGGVRWLRWPLLGAGVAAAGAGAYLIGLDGECVGPTYIDRTCPKIWETQEVGIGLAVGGAAAVVGAVAWQLLGGGDSERPAVGLSISGEEFALTFGGSW